MPRAISGNAEAARLRMEEYRRRLRAHRDPETGVVDTALSAALARYIEAALVSGDPSAERVAAGFRGMAVSYLKRQGADSAAAERRVVNRLHYLQMVQRHPDASAADRKRWQLGPLGVDPLDDNGPDAPSSDPDDWQDAHHHMGYDDGGKYDVDDCA